MTSEKQIEGFFEHSVIRDLQGLEYGGEQIVRCFGCDRELFVIMKISPEPTIINLGYYGKVAIPVQYFHSNCPFCDKNSWKVKVEGKCMYRGSHGKTIISDVDIDMVSDNTAAINTLTLMKDMSKDNGE